MNRKSSVQCMYMWNMKISLGSNVTANVKVFRHLGQGKIFGMNGKVCTCEVWKPYLYSKGSKVMAKFLWKVDSEFLCPPHFCESEGQKKMEIASRDFCANTPAIWMRLERKQDPFKVVKFSRVHHHHKICKATKLSGMLKNNLKPTKTHCSRVFLATAWLTGI